MSAKSYKKILVFNVNWLGDVLFSTAVIRNIRHNYPESYLACIIPPRCYPVLKGNPYLDEIIIFDEKDRHKGVFSLLNFIRVLRLKKFDAVFLLHKSFSRALVCRLAGIPERIGHFTKKRAFLLTKKIIPPQRDSLHRIDYYLDVIEKSGLRIEDRYTDFFVSAEDNAFTEDFFRRNSVKDNDFIVVCNPGGNWSPKRWPRDYWPVLADKLAEKFGAKIILTGAVNDLSLVTYIRDKMMHKPLVACGAFNIKQFGALARKASLFITADTGPLHIANSVGAKKIIALFGPTSPAITGPYPLKNVIILQKNVGCKIPCYETGCHDNRCMKAITPDDVIEEVKSVMTNDKIQSTK